MRNNMTNDLLENFKNFFTSEKLEENTFAILISIIIKMDIEEQRKLWIFLECHPNWISKLENNIISKRNAFKTKNDKAWNEIIEREYTDLLKIEIANTK